MHQIVDNEDVAGSRANATDVQTIRFHTCHGENITLSEDNTVAERNTAYADAIIFSERALQPGELFLIEIEESEQGDSRHLRLGLTKLFPKFIGSRNEGLPEFQWPNCDEIVDIISKMPKRFTLPKFSWPDMEQMGNTWLFPISLLQYDDTSIKENVSTESVEKSINDILGETSRIRTQGGLMPKSMLEPFLATCDTVIGSRIGIVYVPKPENHLVAEVNIIVNGVPRKINKSEVPLNGGHIHVVIDLFGKAKRVRIIQPKIEVDV